MKFFKIIISLFIFVLFIGLIGGWFYWTQIRPANIKKNCYAEAFRPNEDNLKWAEGKVWTYLTAFANEPHGWVYPDYGIARITIYDASALMKKDMYDEKTIVVQTLEKVRKHRNDVFKQCLVREGISISL